MLHVRTVTLQTGLNGTAATLCPDTFCSHRSICSALLKVAAAGSPKIKVKYLPAPPLPHPPSIAAPELVSPASCPNKCYVAAAYVMKHGKCLAHPLSRPVSCHGHFHPPKPSCPLLPAQTAAALLGREENKTRSPTQWRRELPATAGCCGSAGAGQREAPDNNCGRSTLTTL